MIVTVDGPAGAGKSTVAKALAAKLGFRYLDTGAMYRALTWLALERGVGPADGPALATLGRANPVGFDEGGRTHIAGTDVTEPIRRPEVDRVVSLVSRHPEVRALMRERQRELAALGDSVIEGRDIGNVVVPQAEVKVYLVADERVRAGRRLAERPGADGADLAAEMHRRDRSDAPQMTPAPDAVEIDTTNLTVDEVVATVEALVMERRKKTKKEYLYNYKPWHQFVGKATVGLTTRTLGRLRSYGHERVPDKGGLVLASNHFSFADPPVYGAICRRRIYFLAKTEIMRVPGARQFFEFFGTVPIRRGESDREAVRRMREIARAGEMLGVFVEGTRQRSGVPGQALPGAAMVALQENVPVLPAAVRGSESWRWWNFHPITLAFGYPMDFSGLPVNSKGYREATVEIQREIRRLWTWLGEVQAQGRPRGLVVPRPE
jgi:cytidylate kinase